MPNSIKEVDMLRRQSRTSRTYLEATGKHIAFSPDNKKVLLEVLFLIVGLMLILSVLWIDYA